MRSGWACLACRGTLVEGPEGMASWTQPPQWPVGVVRAVALPFKVPVDSLLLASGQTCASAPVERTCTACATLWPSCRLAWHFVSVRCHLSLVAHAFVVR